MKKRKMFAGFVLLISLMGTVNVHGAGFSPDPYLNSLNKTLDEMNRQYQQQYDKILEDLEKSIEKSKKEKEEKEEVERKEKEELENRISEGLDFVGLKIFFDEQKEKYLLQGCFVNENEDYEINNLSEVEISIYDQNGDFIISVRLKDEYMEEIVIQAEDITLYEFYLPEDIDKNDYSFENFSTTLSCNYHYSEAQEKEDNQDGTVSSYTPSYQYDYYDHSTQSQSDMETDCPLCTNGKVTCKSCHGSGRLSFSRSSANYGAGSTSYNQEVTCATCQGSGKQICLGCGGDGKI